MQKFKLLKGTERIRFLDMLYLKYAASKSWRQRWTYFRKKYSWLLVVEGAKFIKRSLDIFISALSLIVLFPLLLIIALLIKLQDGGPIFYVTDRVGKWGMEFKFPKFRTMILHAEVMQDNLMFYNEREGGGDKSFKIRKDPRITKLGYFLRRMSLDELPQLWSVLKGDMSLVGPRPPLPKEVAHYTIQERRRLDITPGLTCIWQVSGRAEIPFSQQLQLDLQYIESQSFWLDVKLLIKTIPAVIFGRGAF